MDELRLSQVVGGGYERYWRDKHRYRVLKGGKGSKKSTTTALNFIYRMMKYPDSNLLVVRAAAVTHRDSTYAQLLWAQRRLGVAHLWENTVSPMRMVYKPTGQKILFRGMDDVLKLASATVETGYLCWVWVEEAFEIESEADFDKLDMSVPRGQLSKGLFKQTTLTFNPWNEEHWLKKRFFDRKDTSVSVYTTNYLCNEFLTPEDIAVIERLKEVNYRRYAVAGLGEWGVSEGLVYENYEVRALDRKSLGVRRDAQGEITENRAWQWRCFFGLDYGYATDPTAFIAFAANPIEKVLYIFDEFYHTGMTNSDIAEEIRARGYAKERIRADCAEPKSNADLRRLGIARVQPSVKGKDSVLNGIANIQEYKMVVHPRCRNTVKELNSYVYAKDKTGRPTGMPEDRNNHLMDALRYAFYDVQFFRPEDPDVKKRATHAEYYNMQFGVTADDFTGGWE
ncbi:MAG: PBSX family phage terminase large subunit [Clostridia bacterium]|nr:PBSX family phage terminase large subunit [Clostridia bacterium]